MSNIVSFNNSLNDNNTEIYSIFNDIKNRVNKVKIGCDKDIDDTYEELDYLESYIIFLLTKTKDKNWKTQDIQERFIKKYNKYNDYDIDDELYKVFYLSEFIYYTDLDSSIVNEDDNYLDLIIRGIDNNLDTISIKDKDSIKRIIKSVRTPIIKDLFDFKDEELFKMTDIVDSIYNYIDLYTISTWYEVDPDNEYKKIIEDDLSNGILTFERVYKYYLEQEDLCYLYKLESFYKLGKTMSDREITKHKIRFDSISKILLLKSYPEQARFNYLLMVREIASKKKINEEIEDISNLTNFYVKNKLNINNYSYEEIRKIYTKGKEMILKNENR